MIPRIEQKAELAPSNYLKALEWLRINNFNILYPERIVSSIYFDNDSLQSYYDTLEGNTPRRKIRIRSYGENPFYDFQKRLKIEIKLSKEFDRFKSQEDCIDFKYIFENGFYDSQYGLCFPSAKVSYIREYYIYKNWRVTIDRYIKYENPKDNLVYNEENYVLEIKTSINESSTEIKNFFEFPRSKFSKYERAIESFLS